MKNRVQRTFNPFRRDVAPHHPLFAVDVDQGRERHRSNVANAVAEFVAGNHDLTGLDPRVRRLFDEVVPQRLGDWAYLSEAPDEAGPEAVEFVVALARLMKAIHAIGESEETFAWSLSVGVTRIDGTRLGDCGHTDPGDPFESADPDEYSPACDTFRVNAEKQTITLVMEGCRDTVVPISHIKTLHLF